MKTRLIIWLGAIWVAILALYIYSVIDDTDYTASELKPEEATLSHDILELPGADR